MALPVATQLRYWAIAGVVLVLILWALGQTLLPFVMGGAVAYLLDPLADRLERLGLSRVLATVVISLAAVLVFFVLILAILPTLIEQAAMLFQSIPLYAQAIRDYLITQFPDLVKEGSALRSSLTSLGETVSERGGALLSGLVSSVASIVNVMVLIVIVPVVAFYLLLDWDRLTAKMDDLLPRDHAPVIRQLCHEINQTMAGFIRGQGTVCLCLGIYYAVALMLVGLQFGIVVGFIAGFLTFIPYVGALIGGALAFGLALFQFWGGVEIIDGASVSYATNWTRILIVAAIFVSGQMIEGNILTPKLVGSSVGLHPVWLIFALSVFGSLFGFVGMLVAVPLAAVIGVITRFMIARYKGSKLYQGHGTSRAHDDTA